MALSIGSSIGLEAATFTDANWISMGGIPGADGRVYAAVVDNSGNLYIGGDFQTVGDVTANRVAKWDGSKWTALGPGINLSVSALAVSGSGLYAAGNWVNDLGTTMGTIAKWDGTNWTALGSGMNGPVIALAVLGNDIYAGGNFRTAGGTAASRIAKWNGSSWNALGTGMNGEVASLAVSGSDLYAGAGSRRREGNRPKGLPNGMGTVGRRWVREWTAFMCLHWRCRAATC